jgi:hypothetical protein
MPSLFQRTRILEFPHTATLVNARLDDWHEETRRQQRELVLDYGALRLSAPMELVEHHGRPHERVRGEYVQRRLRFRYVRWVKSSGMYTHLADVSRHDSARLLEGLLCWRTTDGVENCLLLDHARHESSLLFSARAAVSTIRSSAGESVEYLRDWSPPPLLPPRIIPEPRQLHQQFGGDPITVHVQGRAHRQRLFVGGLQHQNTHRPQVNVVLNLSENMNAWSLTEADRWVLKGEGKHGMDITELKAEARWVIAQLQAGRSVLVHCAVGFNRSVTVCCAVLILLEGLSAEDALARVRVNHPWARPDSHHWLVLRWLARSQ